MEKLESMALDTRFKLSRGGLLGWMQRRFKGADFTGLAIRWQVFTAVVMLWLPLVGLTLWEGTFWVGQVDQPFGRDVVPQVRFLLALPLLLLADLLIDPAVDRVIRTLVVSGVVPATARQTYDRAVGELCRRRDAIAPDLVMLLMAVVSSWLLRPGYGDSAVEISDTTWLWALAGSELQLSLAGWWYLAISAPIFQWVLFRWCWRFLIWAFFLFRVSRLRLALCPSHADRAGGLGLIGISQQSFVVVFLAFATVMASTLAHHILFEEISFHDSRPEIVVFVFVCVALLFAPLLFFTPQLYFAKQAGLAEYGVLAYRLSRAFRRQWIDGADEDNGLELLHSTDPSAVADYGAVYEAVRGMGIVPLGYRGLLSVTALIAAPFLPLSLTEFSVVDLLQRVADSLV